MPLCITAPRLLAAVAGFCLVFLGNIPVSAEFVYVSSNRFVSVDAPGFDSIGSSTDDLEDFEDLVQLDEVISDSGLFVGSVNSISSQSSSMSEFRISGIGRASSFASGPMDQASATADSAMEITFDIEETTTFVLDGHVRMTPTGQELFGASAIVRLTGPSGVIAEAVIDQDGMFPDNGIATVSFSGSNAHTGQLTPGRYTIEAAAHGVGIGSHTRCPDFEFDLTVLQPIGVPEPTSAMLFLLGLLAIARRRIR